jgi:hypothetical protein
MTERILKTLWKYTWLTGTAMGVTALALATFSGLIRLHVSSYSLTFDTVVLYSLSTCFVLLLAFIFLAYQRGVQLSAQTVSVYRLVLALLASGVGSAFAGTIQGDEPNPTIRATAGLALFVSVYWLNPAKFLSTNERSTSRRNS